jgi:ABC-2 type transport system permease protein
MHAAGDPRAAPSRRVRIGVIRGLMLRGADLSTLWPDALALIGFSVAMMTLAILRFRKRLD